MTLDLERIGRTSNPKPRVVLSGRLMLGRLQSQTLIRNHISSDAGFEFSTKMEVSFTAEQCMTQELDGTAAITTCRPING